VTENAAHGASPGGGPGPHITSRAGVALAWGDSLQAANRPEVPLPQRLRLISSWEADRDHAEALKHLRTLINVASETDDLEEVYKILREMRGVVDNAMPPKPATPHIRSVK
jgi:hypothetical protein